jgi:prephenate dehydrogenase
MQPKRLSVLGVGLLGGSIGLAVKSILTDCTVAGYGHRPETLDRALARGAIDEAYVDPRQAVQGADLVVLCTPVGMLESVFDQIAPALALGALVTDVGSTKRRIVAHARKYPGVRFIGSHPMAGSEKRGVEFAQADLFTGAKCVLTPNESPEADALAAVDAFWRLLKMETCYMPPEVHDWMIANISHVPHAIAAALVTMQDGSSLSLAGKGFADVTRIAAGDGGLWRDIFVENEDNLRLGLQRLQQVTQTLLDHLARGDGEAVKAWLEAAAERRQSLVTPSPSPGE